MRVLAVDDSKLLRMEIELMLERVGLTVDTAANGLDAMTCLRRQHYDLLLTDIDLPDASGLEVLRQARLIDPSIRAILLTGSSSVVSCDEAEAAGAAALLLKPFELQALLREVRQALPTLGWNPTQN
jgi:CheY-like chemotaxis protein